MPNINDYVVTSVRRHTGDDQQDIPVYLRRISGLEEATTEQINNSYIVLADSENHKNYKTNLGNIIRSLKQDSTDKVQALKTIIEAQLNEIRNNIVILQDKVEVLPTLEQIESLISGDINNITDIINELLESKANVSDIESLRTSINSSINDILAQFESLHQIAKTGDYNDLENKPNISEEINTTISDLQEAINNLPANLNKIDIILNELMKEDSEISENDILKSRIDDLMDRVEYLEQYGTPSNPTSPTGPTGPTNPTGSTPPTPQPKITYKFWLISDNELTQYFNGETFTNEDNFISKKFIASKVNGCPFTNDGYPVLYLIKEKFVYDSSTEKIDGKLYLVIPTKYGSINAANNTIKINGKTLSSGVFKIYGNEYYKQNISIEGITYHIIRVSKEESIGDGIELNLI